METLIFVLIGLAVLLGFVLRELRAISRQIAALVRLRFPGVSPGE